jgi:hypothetical protein
LCELVPRFRAPAPLYRFPPDIKSGKETRDMTETQLKADVTTALADVKSTIGTLETDAKADVAKVKTVWQSHVTYIVAFVSLVIGIVAGHIFK